MNLILEELAKFFQYNLQRGAKASSGTDWNSFMRFSPIGGGAQAHSFYVFGYTIC